MRVGLREEGEDGGAGTSTEEDTSTQLSPCFILVFLQRPPQTLPQDVQPPSAPLTSSRYCPYFSHCKRGRYLPGQLTFSRPHVSDEEELVFALYYRLSKYSVFFFLGGWILNDGGMMNLFVKMVSCICGSLLKLGENLKDSVWNVLYPSKNQFDFHLIYDLPFLFCRDLFLPE